MRVTIAIFLSSCLLPLGCGGENKQVAAPKNSANNSGLSPDVRNKQTAVVPTIAPAKAPPPTTPSEPAASASSKDPKPMDDYVSFPSLGVMVRKPAGFEKSDSFDGFGLPQSRASVMVMKLPAPFQEASKGFTAEEMQKRGWNFISSEPGKVGEFVSLLVHFEQPAGGMTFEKWSFAFGDVKTTYLITATFPKDLSDTLSTQLKEVVLSTKIGETVPADPLADFPYEIDPPKNLKLAPGINRILSFTVDGKFPTSSPDAPLLIIATSIGDVVVLDRRDYAERQIKANSGSKTVTIKTTEAIEVDGLKGFESVAETTNPKTGVPLVIYQLILFSGDSYVVAKGIVRHDEQENYLSDIQAAARSIRKKPSN